MQLNPMLPELRERPFDDDGYIFEPKADGMRVLLSLNNGIVRLHAKHRVEATRFFPELCRVPARPGVDLLLDGVVVFWDERSGVFSSEELRERMRLKTGLDIRSASIGRPVRYFAFDLLELNGEDLRGEPLRERRRRMDEVLEENRQFHRLPSIEGQGRSLFEAIGGEGVEGIVAKRLDSPYVGGRSADWLAVRKYRYADVRIAGYRKRGFGWLMERDGRPLGVMECPVPAAYREAFQGVARAIETGEDRDFVYVQPVIGARIRYLHLSRNGGFRFPEFVRFVV